MEDLDVEENVRSIPLWRVVLSIFGLVLVLLASIALVCGTDAQCRSRIPTLGELLNSPMVAPFIVTVINSILSLHLLVSIGIYYKTEDDGYIVARVQMASSVVVYVSMVITLFVFPFTSWDRNWANVSIVVALAFWMLMIVLCLRKHYRYKASPRRKLVNLQIVLLVLYVLWSIVYVSLRFFPVSIYLLISEIGSGGCVLAFLLACIVHLWTMELQVII